MTTELLLEGILRRLDASWRHLVSERTATNSLPCVRAASADWWLDPDGDDRGGHNQTTRENQLRARLLCYDCPIISECRQRGAVEEHNVWGGLSAHQRRRLAKGQPVGKKRTGTGTARGGLTREQVQQFKAGWTCEDIGLQAGQAAGAVLYQLEGLVVRTEAAWEERYADVCGEVAGMVRRTRLAG